MPTIRSSSNWLAVWAPVPIRLAVGYGFMAHGYAKFSRGPEKFAVVLHTLGVPEPLLAAWAATLTKLIGGAFSLEIKGSVDRPIRLLLADIKKMPATELIAVNQCSGNSRGFANPRVAGGQLGNGAMGNARWKGIPLKTVLDQAGVQAGALRLGQRHAIGYSGVGNRRQSEADNLQNSPNGGLSGFSAHGSPSSRMFVQTAPTHPTSALSPTQH